MTAALLVGILMPALLGGPALEPVAEAGDTSTEVVQLVEIQFEQSNPAILDLLEIEDDAGWTTHDDSAAEGAPIAASFHSGAPAHPHADELERPPRG